MLAQKTIDDAQMLGELPGASETEKIEVWERSDADGARILELVEYAWGSGLGWFVRKRLSLEPSQAAALAALLGGPSAAPRPPRLRHAPPVQREENVIRLLLA